MLVALKTYTTASWTLLYLGINVEEGGGRLGHPTPDLLHPLPPPEIIIIVNYYCNTHFKGRGRVRVRV